MKIPPFKLINMCLYPKLIKNPKYKANKKNGGIIPECTDNRILYVPIGCGNCIECMKQKARQWQVRLSEEIKQHQNMYMVTLTFGQSELETLSKEAEYRYNINRIEENEIATLAVRRFLERWRKKYKKSVKHWLVTELGHNGTERIHLHGIIFTDKPEEIEPIWNYGYVYLGQYVNEKTINYIIKYVHKIDADHKGYKPKVLTSAGIGSNYINRIDSKNNKFKGDQTQEYYKTRTGLKLNLPIYYRNKIYTEEQREQLWINKLDQNIRYVMGEKIDIGENEKIYEETLKYYQDKNKRLGYGDDSKDWSKEQYKEQRKLLKRTEKKDV